MKMQLRWWLWPGALLALSLLFLGGCPKAALASSCGVSTYPVVTSHVVAKPVVTKVVKEVVPAYIPVTVYQPVPVFVPAYTASYHPAPLVPAPAPAPAPQAGPSPEAKAVLEALGRINARLDALEGRHAPAPAPAPTPTPTPGPRDPFNPGATSGGNITTPATPAPGVGKAPMAFGAKCAQCHTRGKEDEGGGFVLLEPDGSVARLEPAKVLAVARRTRRSYNSTMPPRKSGLSLTDAEVAEIMAWLDTVK